MAHLLDILQHHVAMPVKRLDAAEQLFVVSKRDEHLALVPHRLLEHRQRALADLVLLQLADLRLVQLGLGDVGVLTVFAECWGSAGRVRDERRIEVSLEAFDEGERRADEPSGMRRTW